MITTFIYIISAIVIFTVTALVVVSLARRYLRLRGPRVVTCPADNTQAAVEVNPVRGILTGRDLHNLQLQSCSHWPERENCGQACLQEIAASPEGCLVRNILAGWYADKTCALCGKAFGKMDWMEHKPCLMAPDRTTRDWSQIHPLDLSQTLATSIPVCWNCHIAATFRRKYPELVTDRPWKR
ncbi:MAG TPA: hypothetical protein VE398_14745 [Acidobacteriota bacterium]|nr:hypothetical protein [Acidobacteriota bacterium]